MARMDTCTSQVRPGARSGQTQEGNIADLDRLCSPADERNLPPAGRIPEPEDILGSVYVEGGKVGA